MPIRPDNRPSDYEYAILSNDVYADKQEEDLVSIDVPGGSKQEWEVIAVQTGALSYFGALYKNYNTQHLILAHRGSDCFGSFVEDIKGIFLNADSPQKKAAYEFTRQAIELARKNRLTLSFTGHSLGAYLSELSLYFCVDTVNPKAGKFDVREGAHAVTFESPGFFNTMEELLHPHVASTGIKESSLDITTYLSYPNLINTCNSHVGTVYTLMPDVGGWTTQLPGFHIKRVHSMIGIVDLFAVHPEKRPNRLCMTDWPLGNQRSEYFKTVTLKEGKYHWQDEGKTKEGEESDLSTYVLKEVLGGYGLSVQGHFKVDMKLSNWFTVPVRHFSSGMQEWLEKFYGAIGYCVKAKTTLLEKLKAKLTAKGISTDLIDGLLGTILSKNHYKDYFYLESLSGDGNKMLSFRRELTRWLSEHEADAQALLDIMHEIQNEPDIQAMFLAPGAETLPGSVINNPQVQAIQVYIPDDMNEQMVDYSQTVSRQFFKNIKDADIKVNAMFAAPGAKIAGTINNASVTAVKFTVGKPIAGDDLQRLLPAQHGFDSIDTAAELKFSPVQVMNAKRQRDGLAIATSSSAAENNADDNNNIKKNAVIK